jgi:hypothetical protein
LKLCSNFKSSSSLRYGEFHTDKCKLCTAIPIMMTSSRCSEIFLEILESQLNFFQNSCKFDQGVYLRRWNILDFLWFMNQGARRSFIVYICMLVLTDSIQYDQPWRNDSIWSKTDVGLITFYLIYYHIISFAKKDIKSLISYR